MRMPLNPRKAAQAVEKSMSTLDNVIVSKVKQKTSADVDKEKKAKKKQGKKKA